MTYKLQVIHFATKKYKKYIYIFFSLDIFISNLDIRYLNEE